jgi:hypothetical protein
MSYDYIYSTLEDAVSELDKRKDDKVLEKKLLDFWGENKPYFFDNEVITAVLSKPIITPNLEFKYFLDVAQEFGLSISLLEYKDGKFVGKNPEKKHLGKLLIYKGHGKKNGNKLEHLSIVNFNKEEGKKLSEVATLTGKNLATFHSDLLKKAFAEFDFKTFDISSWFNRTRYLDAYYLYYLSLFIKDGILFENFVMDQKEESKFTFEKFIPSFEKATEIFGVKPLIVPLLPLEHEKSNLWFSYDEKVEKIIRDML